MMERSGRFFVESRLQRKVTMGRVLMGRVWHLQPKPHTAPDSVAVNSDGECSKS